MDNFLLFQFGGLMTMTNDVDSCRLCDTRLISINSKTLNQQIVEYQGAKIEGRKFPTLSSGSNMIEDSVQNQKLFIFGGYRANYSLIEDKGYYMYDISQN